MQAMLLRFLENGEIQPVGSDAPAIRSDVRVISATNRDLAEMVTKGEFREDLLYRIKVAHVHVPPLRDRKEDVRPLIDEMLRKSEAAHTVSEDAYSLLEQYRWPGNVRELHNVIEQATAMAAGGQIGVDDLPQSVTVPEGSHLYPRRERRRRVSDRLFEELTGGKAHFWNDVHALFASRDITRADVRDLIRRGLSATSGNYRALVQLFGMPSSDYKKVLNFLAAHDCMVDYREFRHGWPAGPRTDVRREDERRSLTG
jgi:DNA-binding NtrC family response regulator